jgi:hypothetical protein
MGQWGAGFKRAANEFDWVHAQTERADWLRRPTVPKLKSQESVYLVFLLKAYYYFTKRNNLKRKNFLYRLYFGKYNF